MFRSAFPLLVLSAIINVAFETGVTGARHGDFGTLLKTTKSAVSLGEEKKGEEKEGEEGGEEEEEVSAATLSVSGMLCGSMTFVMGMFYLVNHPNSDMKRYSWQTISSTISIFIAVLLFQGVNGLVNEFVVRKDTPDELGYWATTLVGFIQQWVWLAILFVVLEKCATSDAEGDEWAEKLDEEDKELIELNMDFFATLFAHINGFAAINSFGELQQMPFFAMNPATAFIMCLIAFVYTTLVFKMLDKYRERLEEAWNNEERSDLWNEGAEDAEDDIGALCISFLWAQSLRFAITGYMPNAEGESRYPGEKVPYSLLFIQFIACLILAAGILVVNKSIGDAPSAFKITKLSNDGKKFAHFISHVLGMTFAWILLYSGTELADHLELSDPVLAKVIVALCVSVVAYLAIASLEIIEHKAELTAVEDIAEGQVAAGLQVEDNMKAIGQLILSIGILIGFSWEKSFDAAIDAISEVSEVGGSKGVGNFIITMILFVIVAPAWRKYIIPMVTMLDERYAEQLQEEFGIDLTAKDLEGDEGGGMRAFGSMAGSVGLAAFREVKTEAVKAETALERFEKNVTKEVEKDIDAVEIAIGYKKPNSKNTSPPTNGASRSPGAGPKKVAPAKASASSNGNDDGNTYSPPKSSGYNPQLNNANNSPGQMKRVAPPAGLKIEAKPMRPVNFGNPIQNTKAPGVQLRQPLLTNASRAYGNGKGKGKQ